MANPTEFPAALDIFQPLYALACTAQRRKVSVNSTNISENTAMIPLPSTPSSSLNTTLKVAEKLSPEISKLNHLFKSNSLLITLSKDIPRHPLDSEKQHELGLFLNQGDGHSRFPKPALRTIVHLNSFRPEFKRVYPVKFEQKDFEALWEAPPVHFRGPPFAEEFNYADVRFKAYVPEEFLTKVIHRGTTIVIGNLESPYVKYVATIRRSINESYSLVQFNAITLCGDFIRYDDTNWPTLLLGIPNYLCAVPMPRDLIVYYTQYITTAHNIWSNIVDNLSDAVKCGVHGKKWKVDVLDTYIDYLN